MYKSLNVAVNKCVHLCFVHLLLLWVQLCVTKLNDSEAVRADWPWFWPIDPMHMCSLQNYRCIIS